jgi:NADP-dependent 3-hydroxy acid dehydrogenase YdfG
VERLARVAAMAREAGAPEAECHALDVTRTDSVRAFADWVGTRTPRVDVLVNNAGGAHGADPVEQASDADWEAMFQTNVLGLLRVTRALLPRLRRSAVGIIINVGSVAGREAYEGGAAYCAAKAGVLQITRALRLELCGSGLRVATVDPGLAETEFSLVRFKGDAARAARVYAGVEPLRAEDVAEAIAWVASRPAHVCVDEMVIKCTDQAAIHKVHRRPVS